MLKLLGLGLIFTAAFGNSKADTYHSDLCSKNIEPIISKKVHDYLIQISYAGDRTCQRLEIFKHHALVFHEEGIDNHYEIKPRLFGMGNQTIVSKWTGGAHCCTSFLMFNFGTEKFENLGEIYGGNFDPEVMGIGNDGVIKIKITDDFLAYQFSSFGNSAKGEVILKYSNGKYILAEEYMKRPVSPARVLAKKIASWKRLFSSPSPEWPPAEFIQTLTDLIFTGNGARASKFIEAAWPSNVPGKNEFVIRYKAALADSKYYSKAASYLP